MPGRQAHGRSLLPTAAAPRARKASTKSRATKALDAFAIAEGQVTVSTRGVRTRDLEEEPERAPKRHRDDDDEDEDDDEDGDEAGDGPRNKRPRKEADDDEFDGFSGSDEEEWHVGVNNADEDSDIDSDEAFGDSDNEKFDGYAFGGSSSKKTKKKKGAESEGESDDEDLESLGSDAIDLATALDQWSGSESGSESGGEEGEEESDEDEGSSEESSGDEDDEDPSKLDALQKVIAGFAGDNEEGDNEPFGPRQKAKLSLTDLGLAGVKDPHIKKSLKLMNKEDKATKPGSSKKLDIPLAKRQQDRLLRSAAYEKTTETLDRWIDTVKHNRRADHLIFPLAQNAQDKGLNNSELMPITQKTSGTELEQTILAIMEESGLGPSAKPEKVEQEGDLAGQEGLTEAEVKELLRQRRRERELHSREAARSKRIKKIKSKAYRRIHRRELRGEEQAAHDALEQAGELDSGEEREAQERRRAAERMGTKHRESKWAKLGKKAGRAVWDDDFRSGLTEMAQKNQELRRRVEGRAKNSDDEDDDMSDASYESGDGGDKRHLLEQLNGAAAYEDDEPQSALMKMKFMQRGEDLRKKENDDLVDQIRRDLGSDSDDAGDIEEVDIGRRQFGGKAKNPFDVPNTSAKSKNRAAEESKHSGARAVEGTAKAPPPEPEPEPGAPGAAGAWSREPLDTRKSKKASKGLRVEELDLSNAAMLATKPVKVAKASKAPKSTGAEAVVTKNIQISASVIVQEREESDDEDAIHLPMAIRDQELIKRAFAGEDVVGEFEREKNETMKEDDDKEVDNTLPGWGNWVGDGVSAREKSRHQGRFMTKVGGVKQKDRKDFKMKGVIISEKRIKKNDKYLATQLPHPFESQQQYERSLRLPVGPEWSTKETFQETTKPRVIVKQGIIAPMSKPVF
ncbi:Utp14 protein-domain-containing protein [Lasiosphaeria hispida]|uniref:Utp14 protein-domain-containing protein n=1 Tax=Lasiosphaeria hispida TaxID=260671 RepID=A0AAJ0HF27_9PEZI|nr:Utp14 protein-domain-containing protein [Lasiosphaeria hispida]